MCHTYIDHLRLNCSPSLQYVTLSRWHTVPSHVRGAMRVTEMFGVHMYRTALVGTDSNRVNFHNNKALISSYNRLK